MANTDQMDPKGGDVGAFGPLPCQLRSAIGDQRRGKHRRPAEAQGACRSLSLSRMVAAFGPDLNLPYQPQPAKSPRLAVTGPAVDLLEVMVRRLVLDGIPISRASSMADIAWALEQKRRRKRGRRPVGPRLVLRTRGNLRVVYIRHGSHRETTYIEVEKGEDFRTQPGALAALAEYVEKEVRRILNRILMRDITMSTVYVEYLDEHKPGKNAHSLDRDNYERIEAICAQLERYNGGSTLEDITIDEGRRYTAWRLDQACQGQPEGADLDEIRRGATTTAASHVGVFIEVLNWFYDRHRLGHIRIKRPKVRRAPVKWLTWDQIMRLLRAANGLVFDEDGHIVGRHALRARYSCLRRVIVIYFYGGTRNNNIRQLIWGKHLTFGHIDTNTGKIVRQGPEAPVTVKRRGTSDLIGSLATLAPKWEAADRARRGSSRQLFINIVHDEDGLGLARGRINTLFRELRDLAGLPWAKPHMLKHSGVTLCTKAGMSREDISVAFSTAIDTLEENYTHLEADWRRPRDFNPRNLRLLQLRRFSEQSVEKVYGGLV
jgi:integrase